MARVVMVFVVATLLGMGFWALWSRMGPSEEEQVIAEGKATVVGRSAHGARYIHAAVYREASDYEIQIIVDEKVQPQVEYKGEIWVEGVSDKEYRIVITSSDDCKNRISVCVDGLDIKNREICKSKPSYLFSERIDLLGFRIDRETVSAFVFTDPSKALAAQLGLKDEIGVICIEIDRDHDCDVIEEEYEYFEDGTRLYTHCSLKSIGLSPDSSEYSGLGTGAGRTISSPMGSGGFSPHKYRDFSSYKLRYDTAAGLCRRGIKSFCR